MIRVPLHDGNKIDVMIQGEGPTILIPVNPIPMEGRKAEEMRKWGADPELGQTLIKGLTDKYRVVAFDYEGHVLSTPKPDSLTPNNIALDFLSIADAADADKFAYYGYSWLALSGLQLAVRTNRLIALIMGGYPPLDGPYKEMLKVTTATYHMSKPNQRISSENRQNPSDYDNGLVLDEESQTGNLGDYDWSKVEVTMDEGQTKQFMTLYQSLQDFDDQEAQSKIQCPRLCFAGSLDKIDYGEQWGNVQVNIAGPLIQNQERLKIMGWDVCVLEGLDHTGAMQAGNVLSIIRSWLDLNLLSE